MNDLQHDFQLDSAVDYRAEYAAALAKWHAAGDQLTGLCPFHDDRSESFSANLTTGQWHCFAGCGKGNFVDFWARRHGVSTKDAFRQIAEKYASAAKPASRRAKKPTAYTLEQYADEKHLPAEWLAKNCHLQTKQDWQNVPYLATPYVAVDADGAAMATIERRRYGGKDFRWPKGSGGKIPLYGEWLVERFRRGGARVALVEGESDAQTLWFLGLPALGVPGAEMFRPEHAEKLRGLTLCIHQEPDKGGEAFTQKILDAVKKIDPAAQPLVWRCSDLGAKDPSELFCARGKDEAARLLKNAIESAQETAQEAAEKNADARFPAALTLNSIAMRQVPWLLPGALARGEISLLGADGGTGKGFVQAALIASVTTGRPCEFFGGKAPEKPGNVVIFPGEDDPENVLTPRLLAAGADAGRVTVVTPTMYYAQTGELLTMNSDAFRFYCTAHGGRPAPDLIIIDPLQSFLPSKVDMAKRNEMRAILTPLATICEETGAAGLIAMHTNKKLGVSGRQRLADSSDLWDMARAVYMMGFVPKEKGVRYLSNEKNNYAKTLQTALLHVENSFAVDDAGNQFDTGLAVFDSYTDKRDFDYQIKPGRQQSGGKLDAESAILEVLSASPTGCVESSRLRLTVMEQTGCSEATYKRARISLKDGKQIFPRLVWEKSGKRTWYIYRYAKDIPANAVESNEDPDEKTGSDFLLE